MPDGQGSTCAARGRIRDAADGFESVAAYDPQSSVNLTGTETPERILMTLRPSAPGFRIDDLAVASFSLPRPTYDDPSATRRFAEDLVASVESSTGAPAAVTTDLPLTGITAFLQATRETPDGEPTGVHFRAVSVGYLELMEMRLLAHPAAFASC